MKVLNKWLFIAHPSVRTLAYINTLNELSIAPEYVIWMMPEKTILPNSVQAHWQKFNYSTFFKPDQKIANLVNQYSVSTDDINSSDVEKLIHQISPEFILFSGGGIVSQSTFSASTATWLHFHPGALPEYRGSTCFYYSYLNEKRLECSGFEMTPILDQGKVLQACQFVLNYPLKNDEVYFIDYVLDPQIRRLALRIFLQNLTSNSDFYSFNDYSIDLAGVAQATENDWPYYVIHPELRSLCAHTIAKDFNPGDATGLFIKENTL